MGESRANQDFTPGGELVAVGADDAHGAIAEIGRLARFLAAAPAARLRDVAYTCARESKDRPFKVAIVATSAGDLSEKLHFAVNRLESGVIRNSFNRGIYIGTEQCPAPGRTVFLFPGEGTQYPDMLRELALAFPACRAAFDAADTAVASAAPDFGAPAWPPPSHYVFPPSPAAATTDIKSLPTPRAHQTVLAADTAMLFLFTQLGIFPDAAMGVGVGEIVALECAGAIHLPSKRHRIRLLGEGYRLISDIAASRKSVPDCTTLSVAGLTREALARLLAPFAGAAAIAADQAPELFTVAVVLDALQRVEGALASAGASFHPLLAIDKPFHTPLLAPFSNRFLEFYGNFVDSTPGIPVYSCCTAAPIDASSPKSIAETAALQWSRPLDLCSTVRRLYDDGFRVFVELGARGSLTACVSSALRHLPHLAVASNRGHRPDLLQLHHALAALVSHGARFDASVLHTGRDSHLLDFGRPGDCRPARRQRERPLPHSIPQFPHFKLPAGLVAPAPAEVKSVKSSGDSPGANDFPCLDFAEIVRFVPDRQLDLTLHLSSTDFPYIAARAISAGPISAYDKSARGLTPPPTELLAEIMAEAARKLCPGLVVIRIERLSSPDPFLPHDPIRPEVKVSARRESARRGDTTVVAAISPIAPSQLGDAPLATCSVTLAASYPPPPPPAPLSLRNSLRAGWEAGDIYPARLSAGDC
ncbi:MAG: hypothetical protein IJP66_09555, partial [Kiritimatiellae bacterium]|nr:hypothetical protein [Kiritimatiellia bacterium]